MISKHQHSELTVNGKPAAAVGIEFRRRAV
jgi:hypothetical protein